MMALTTVQYLLGAASGSLVGFTLGLVGGGGSILAVPLMVYLVGVPPAYCHRHQRAGGGRQCRRQSAAARPGR